MSASMRVLYLGRVLDWYFGMFTTHSADVVEVVVCFVRIIVVEA